MTIPFKWRFMQVIAGIQLMICLILLCWITYLLYKETSVLSTAFDIVMFVVVYATFCFIANFCTFQVFAIQKYYPDTLYSIGVNRFFIISWFLYLAALICFALLFTFSFRNLMHYWNEAGAYQSYRGSTGFIRQQVIFLSVLFAWIISMLCMLISSYKYRKRIRANFAKKQSGEIDLLGSLNI